MHSSSPRRSTSDPYAESYRRQRLERYEQERKSALETIRTFVFAANCGVVWEEAVGTDFIGPVLAPLEDDMWTFNDYENLTALWHQAVRDGRAQASQPGACDYWHEHPEAVYRIRQAVSGWKGLRSWGPRP